ncbi:ankyrin repeat-containing domain protein [Cercophora newfieldiana]|uniref:Ankyrin repeat-containing domain protein n=1 Tax=Cercophora newfieldiana TaxID=92897 RepID=A0AA40CY98_9PEZI|nr:ankyrin repeat-containing domain protein [Cercophora newfieldiana]
MAVDPGAVVGAVQILGVTLQSVVSIFTSYKNAPVQIQNLQRECDFTRVLLKNIRYRETARKDHSHDSLAGLLQDIIGQLQLEVNELLGELEKLSNTESKIGQWASKGVVVWKKSYLEGMQRKIRAKQADLQLVLNTQVHSHTTELSMMDKRRFSDPIEASLSTNANTKEQFIRAVMKGDVSVVQKFLRYQLDRDFLANDDEELYPLHVAARNGDVAMLGLLLSHGAKPESTSKDGSTPLMVALEHDRCNAALVLIERGGPLTVFMADSNQRTALHIAAFQGYTEHVRLLIKLHQNHGDQNKSPTSAGDILGCTPLWLAARNEHVEIVKMIVNFDPDSPSRNSQDPEAPSPLWALALSKNLDSASKTAGLSILAKSANINARNTQGSTLLHRAAFTGDVDLATLLLNAGADIQIRDNLGRYPLHYAAIRGHSSTLSLLLSHLGDTIINHINSPDNSGLTPLMLAAGSNHANIIHTLSKHGADSLARSTPNGYSALYIACSQGHMFTAAYLLGQGADIDGVDSKGNTCLHVAARNGYVDMVRALLGMGADRSKRSVEPFGG